MTVPSRILLVCLRRLGDVLLTTPLAASLRRAYPAAQIDWLVFESTAGILQGSLAADRVHCLPDRPSAWDSLRCIAPLLQRYDLALSSQAGDRPCLFARLAGRRAYGLASEAMGGSVRDSLLTGVASPDPDAHQVDKVLSLCALVGVPAVRTCLPPEPTNFTSVVEKLRQVAGERVTGELGSPVRRFWVVHPGAAFVYKQWHTEGWRLLSSHLVGQGCFVVVTGGPSRGESEYLENIFYRGNWADQNKLIPAWRAQLSWQELATLLRRAEGFVGVDTSVTHLVAAIGLRCLPIFGPTDPRRWAPISPDGRLLPVVQHRGKACVPCQREGCDRHIASASACLDELSAEAVIAELSNLKGGNL